jgi:hypothetical protein
MGRILAQLVIIYLLWAVVWKLQKYPTFVGNFSTVKVMHLFCQKWVGLHFGRFFSQSNCRASFNFL